MKWTSEERMALQRFVAGQEGHIDWIQCSEILQTKTPRQCYDQYSLQKQNLTAEAPQRNHKWTQEESALLLTKRSDMESWTDFQRRCFPDTTLSQLKNQYQRLHQEMREAGRSQVQAVPCYIQDQSKNDLDATTLIEQLKQLLL